MKQPDVERVAETQFMVRPALVNALKGTVITEAGQKLVGSYATYYDLWIGSFSDRFFDMATLTRLGSAVEVGLRDFHFGKAGAHPPDRGVFQRLVNPRDLLALIKSDCGGYRLDTNSNWDNMRELMVYRHLYAHRSGVVDDKFLADLQAVTGKDLRPEIIKLGYPAQDVSWFGALGQMDDLITAARRFFRDLPE